MTTIFKCISSGAMVANYLFDIFDLVSDALVSNDWFHIFDLVSGILVSSHLKIFSSTHCSRACKDHYKDEMDVKAIMTK